MNKIDIKSMLPCELEGHFNSMGEKGYRTQQVFKWLHNGVTTFDEMTNLSSTLRTQLEASFVISTPKIINKLTSNLDGTIKYLLGMDDNTAIESVLMSYEHGSTICISTQVGCRMGCLFCASGESGFVRNLTASEMLNQVLFCVKDESIKVSNIVLMGIGEPLDNFDNVIRFIRLVTSPLGINIGARHITISTCGIIENIDKLADYGIQLTLAISLHAPDDATRKHLMPFVHKYTVKELFAAGYNYYKKTGRRVTYEYSLIDGINDMPEQAKMLSQMLLGSGSHLNIIPLNYIKGRDFNPSSKKRVKLFFEQLDKDGVNYTMRRSLGCDIDAACGLLRQKNSIGDD